ncbi:helix-turn-helix domain-containing protein [Enterococcus thailandicus]|uniref:helix-turn-helix domain-containing protein n=1 Tax=Enterococcus thailandicus TaxID=417368 RepID=UPI0022E405CF|nr:helix-turn-helix transcriptional regulator [Enterococcus thailandicus]
MSATKRTLPNYSSRSTLIVEIGKKIKELRQSKEMTQKELAEILNVTPQAVSKLEQNVK